MNLLEELKLEKKNLFQFYIIVGNNLKNKKIVSEFLKNELDFDFKKDFFSLSSDDFLIKETRELKKENSLSVGDEKKIIFLDFQKVSLESQNALLKTFEEVQNNSHIFLFLPSENFLLDTVKSRARILKGEGELNFDLAEKFFKGNLKEREKIIDKIDKNNISVFMDSLENLILKNKKTDIEFYKNFLELKAYIFDKGVSLKNILIWIALNLD